LGRRERRHGGEKGSVLSDIATFGTAHGATAWADLGGSDIGVIVRDISELVRGVYLFGRIQERKDSAEDGEDRGERRGDSREDSDGGTLEEGPFERILRADPLPEDREKTEKDRDRDRDPERDARRSHLATRQSQIRHQDDDSQDRVNAQFGQKRSLFRVGEFHRSIREVLFILAKPAVKSMLTKT
jgi:hypothetical protein